MLLEVNYLDAGIKCYDDLTEAEALRLIESVTLIGAAVRWYSELLHAWTRWF